MNPCISAMLVVMFAVTGSAFGQSQSSQDSQRGRTKKKRSQEIKRNARRGDPSRRTSEGIDRRGAYRRRGYSRNPYSDSRARRFRQGGRDGYGYGGYDSYDTTDYAEIYLNQSYYDDGPYGPGFYDRSLWYNWYLATQRSSQLLSSSVRMMDEGMAAFRSGRYDRAAIAWVGASRKDQGDAGSRIHAGHALFAVGRYDAAVKLLARGFELAPRLATSQYDIRSDYRNQTDYQKHLSALKTYVSRHPKNADGVTLLGYVVFYTQGPTAAYPLLKQAAGMRPKDTFIVKLLDVARMVSPLVETESPSAHQTSGRRRPGAGETWKEKAKVKQARHEEH